MFVCYRHENKGWTGSPERLQTHLKRPVHHNQNVSALQKYLSIERTTVTTVPFSSVFMCSFSWLTKPSMRPKYLGYHNVSSVFLGISSLLLFYSHFCVGFITSVLWKCQHCLSIFHCLSLKVKTLSASQGEQQDFCCIVLGRHIDTVLLEQYCGEVKLRLVNVDW